MVRRYLRGSPVTVAYLGLLVVGHIWLYHGLSPAARGRLLDAVSTNLSNLGRDPVGCLLGSALFFDGTLTHVATLSFAGTLIILVLGIGVMLAGAERRWGAIRAYGVFWLGHIGATLLTALVILYGLRHGWYEPSIRHAVDYGISYGAQAVLAAGVLLLPRRVRPFWVLFVVGWPLPGADFHGAVPDFTTVGHLLAAALGFLAAPLVARSRRPSTVDAPG